MYNQELPGTDEQFDSENFRVKCLPFEKTEEIQ